MVSLDDFTKADLIGVALIVVGYLVAHLSFPVGLVLYAAGVILILGGILAWVRRLLGGPVDQNVRPPHL